MKIHTPRATIDYETRSACPIKTHGSWRYATDPTTEELCMAFRLPYWEPGRTGLWHPAFPQFDIPEQADDDLYELFEWIEHGEPVEAHNAWFERGIWVVRREPEGWPRIQGHQWRCSAAKAAAHALPRNLGDACKALHLDISKSDAGHKLMLKMCKPRKPLKKELTEWAIKHAGCGVCLGKGKIKSGRSKAQPCLHCGGSGLDSTRTVPPFPSPIYHESPEMLLDLFDYCRQDVLAEEALSDRLYDLHPKEQLIYEMDQDVNERGYALDREAITVALDIIDEESVDLNRELQEITGGEVERATQRDRMMDWLERNGLSLDNTRKDTIDDVLSFEGQTIPALDPHVRRAVELMRTLGRSSTAKFVKAASWICPDDRAHGGLLYHGASTGRWSGQGVQPHNFVRGGIPDMDLAWTTIKTRDRNRIRDLKDKKGNPYGDVMKVLSEALRGMIVAGPGKRLYVADYAAIEARVLLWLAEDTDALQVFYRGEDIYCYMASDIFGYPCNKKDHPDERAIGKIAVLGLGYQMGASKFVDTAALGGVEMPLNSDDPDEMTAQKIVDAYRTKFWRVKEMWWQVQEAAIEAVRDKGCVMQQNRTEWFCDDGFLFCRLPSGRCLAYPEPMIVPRTMPWGDVRDGLTYKGINQYNHQWTRQHSYGGLLVENITQAVARDLMAEAMLRADLAGYPVVLSVHDELISETDISFGTVREFEEVMAETPAWAEGCPVAAEGWTGLRYRK